MYLNISGILGVGAICRRYAFAILKFSIADISVNKAGMFTFAGCGEKWFHAPSFLISLFSWALTMRIAQAPS
jgi:hypothetical protein